MAGQALVEWVEIPVTDLPKAMEFYSSVFGWSLTLDESGPNPMAMFVDEGPNQTGGHLYPGTPARGGVGPTVHLVVKDGCAAASDRVKLAGGKVVSPPIEIPVGRFVYCEDPDGNSIGLFEQKAG